MWYNQLNNQPMKVVPLLRKSRVRIKVVQDIKKRPCWLLHSLVVFRRGFFCSCGSYNVCHMMKKGLLPSLSPPIRTTSLSDVGWVFEQISLKNGMVLSF